MEKDVFGTIFYNGRMVDLDKEDIGTLEKISKELKVQDEELKNKVLSIFG